MRRGKEQIAPFALTRMLRMAEKTKEKSHEPIEWTAGEGVKKSE